MHNHRTTPKILTHAALAVTLAIAACGSSNGNSNTEGSCESLVYWLAANCGLSANDQSSNLAHCRTAFTGCMSSSDTAAFDACRTCDVLHSSSGCPNVPQTCSGGGGGGSGGDMCYAGTTACARGPYQICDNGTTAYYKTSDGTTFNCASKTDCKSAASALVGWCSAGAGGGTCSDAGQKCTTGADCCVGLTCPRYGTSCRVGKVGDPCSDDGECETAQCTNGWCTQACVSNADCPTLSYCLQDTTAGLICFPFCSSTSQCAVYGSGYNCMTGTTADGTDRTVCTN